MADQDDSSEQKKLSEAQKREAKQMGKINVNDDDEGGGSNVAAAQSALSLGQLVNTDAIKAKAEYEATLAKVVVSKADVELIAHELELDNSKADRLLRIHNNDIAAAIKAYIS